MFDKYYKPISYDISELTYSEITCRVNCYVDTPWT